MEVAASAVTFGVVGLQSIKLLHDVLSTVRDWPADVGNVSGDVAQLRSVLERLVSPSPPNHRDLAESMKDLIQLCERDVEQYAQRLRHFAVSSDERRRGKLWKRLKGVLDEKDLRKMQTVIGSHVQKLSLRIALFQSSNAGTVAARVGDLQDLGTQQFAVQSHKLDSIQTSLQHLSTASVQHLGDQSSKLDCLQTSVQSSSTASIQLLEDQSKKLDSLQGVSIEQQQALATLVEQMKTLQASLSGERIYFSDKAQPSPIALDATAGDVPATDGDGFQSNTPLSIAVERLAKLVDAEPCTMASDEAWDIVDDLSVFLNLAHTEVINRDSIQGNNNDQLTRLGSRDIRKMRGLLESANWPLESDSGLHSYTPDLTYLLSVCSCREKPLNRDVLELLIGVGARVSETDSRGRNCLHIANRHEHLWDKDLRYGRVVPFSWPEAYMEGLVYLVEQGADVHARDRRGYTPSDYAYAHSTHPSAGSVAGDIWDAALARCGSDVSQFRKGYPRKARYSRGYYTREHFEKMWKGYEERCPYWDDEDYYAPGDEARREDEEEHEGSIDSRIGGTDDEDEDSDDGGECCDTCRACLN
ncbi:hypothetical protein F4778DRAFT_784689 [Xylariomycetidae sp. FL2044]|nr:hypothetical protein F4778DRAFT_784689 [Xylariomycetidae sp. FL2044]